MEATGLMYQIQAIKEIEESIARLEFNGEIDMSVASTRYNMLPRYYGNHPIPRRTLTVVRVSTKWGYFGCK